MNIRYLSTSNDNLKQQFNANWNPTVNLVPFRETKV